MLKFVKAHVEAGFAVHLLRRRSKAPFDDGWSKAPVATYAELKDDYRDGMNLGVRLGRPSRVEGMYLHVFDLDIRDEDYADEARTALTDLFPEVNFNRLPTVKSGSGGASRHYYFLSEDPFKSKKLAHSEGKFTDEDGRKHWHWEIELFGTGKQVVLPPSIHPDTGNPYEWLVEPDFEIGIPTIDAEQLIEVTAEDEDFDHDNFDPLGITIEDAEEALEEIQDWADDRETWVRVGMALKHEFGDDGWEIFDRWSKKGHGYDRRENWNQWRSFKLNRDKLYTMRSIMAESNRIVDQRSIAAAIDEMDDADEIAVEAEKEAVAEVKPRAKIATEFEDLPPSWEQYAQGIPARLLRVPGKLQGAVTYFNETAFRPQPQHAVQVALALGSVILGRHYVTEGWGNMASAFFVNLANSSAGKEHTQKTITRLLKAAHLGELIGFAEYSSGAAVTSALKQKPRHISLTDEFHEYLALAKRASDTNKPDAQKALLSVWSKVDGTYLGPAYSTRGQNKQQADQTLDRTVESPALSLMAMGITKLFYSALSMTEVHNGFLNRLLVATSVQGLPPPIKPKNPPIPESLIGWMQRHAWPDTDGPGTGIINRKHGDVVPSPIPVPFSEDALKLVDYYQAKADDKLRELEAENLEALFGRSFELILRISLIVALSDETGQIEDYHVEWAHDYVSFYHEQMLREVRARLGKSEMILIAEEVAEFVEAQGTKGIARNRLANRKKIFGNLSQRDEQEVTFLMERNFNVVFTNVKSKGGPKMRKFIHVSHLHE